MTQHTQQPYAPESERPLPPAATEARSSRADAVRGGRYGAALVATLLGGYLMATQGIGQFVQATAFGAAPPELAALLLSRFLFGVVVLVAGFLIAPTVLWRRLTAAGIAILLTALSSVLFAGRLTGDVRLPMESAIFLHPAFVATLAATAGWLLVRDRHPLTFLLLLLTVVVGVVPQQFALQGLPGAASELTVVPLAAVVGVGIAWAAAGISRALQRR
jgi:hypothetical protein